MDLVRVSERSMMREVVIKIKWRRRDRRSFIEKRKGWRKHFVGRRSGRPFREVSACELVSGIQE